MLLGHMGFDRGNERGMRERLLTQWHCTNQSTTLAAILRARLSLSACNVSRKPTTHARLLALRPAQPRPKELNDALREQPEPARGARHCTIYY